MTDPWSRGREVASGVLRSSPKPEKWSILAVREGSRIFVVCFLHQPPNVAYHTPGRRPPHITGRHVNTVTRGWVEAPNERTPFRFRDAVVGLSIDVCRGLGITQLRIERLAEFFSGRS